MAKKEYEYDESGERLYPDFIKEAQAAYQVTGDVLLRNLLMKKQGEYTVEDYFALPDECRVELIDGVIYNMSAPNIIHQTLVFQIAVQLDAWIKKRRGSCMVVVSPANVQLNQDDKTMLQPDLYVVCDRDKIRKNVLHGAPDLVVEVLSPSNTLKEQTLKYQKYKDAGVREYWTVNPNKKQVAVYYFGCGAEAVIRTFEDKIPVNIFGGEPEIDIADIYRTVEFLDEREE